MAHHLIWFYSDPHFGHYNLIREFVLKDGSPARINPNTGERFKSIEEHDELLIFWHNERVRPQDIVYCLGDVAMSQPAIDRVMPRLNGHKRLVRGNHDIYKTKVYLKYFEEIHATRQLDGLLFSHVPIAPWSFNRAVKANVHGHVHANEPLTYRMANPRAPEGFQAGSLYINLSLERTNYRPWSLEEIKKVVDHAR